MNVNRTALTALKYALMAFFFVSLLNSTLRAEEDVITDIILINGLAELVDLNTDGKVLQRHLSIPDYFSSGRSHKRTLRESLAKTQVYGAHSNGEKAIETIVFKAPKECRQSLMKIVNNDNLLIDYGPNEFYNLYFSQIKKSNSYLTSWFGSSKPLLHNKQIRNRFRRQRTLIYDRLDSVSSYYEPTIRTSKAIIDV